MSHGIQTAQAETHLFEKKYNGFTLFLDCKNHAAAAFRYNLGKTPKNHNVNSVTLAIKEDINVPVECQPTTTDSYRQNIFFTGDQSWNTAFLVWPGHLDNKTKGYKDAHLVTNTLPQNSRFNTIKGAWYQTNKIIECYRDISDLMIWGGVIWGNDRSNDFFTKSHGIATPDYFWKVIYREDTDNYIAWLFPNKKTTLADNIDDYLISLSKLRKVLDYELNITKYISPRNHDIQHLKSWNVFNNFTALNCDGQRKNRG